MLTNLDSTFTQSVPPVVLAALFVGGGVLLLLAGWQTFRLALFLVGGLLGAVLGAELAGALNVTTWIIAAPCALAAGILAVMLQKVGAFFLGGACGLAAVLSAEHMFANPTGFWIAAALAFAIGGMLSLFLWRPMIIVSLALLGAALITDGVVLAIRQIQPALAERLAQHPWGPVAAVAILTVLGVFFQSSGRSAKEEEGQS